MSQWKLSPNGLSASRLLDNGYTEARLVSHISPEELAAALPADPLTQSEQFKDIERALEQHMDAVARADGWDNRWTCMARAGYVNPWQAKGIKFAQWMDACWVLCIQGQQDVIAGTRPMPTKEQAIAELPPIVW